MNYHTSNKACGCKDKKIPCGCNKPELCGCTTKHDLLCSFYSGTSLEPIGIEPGMDGNTVIRMLVKYFEDSIAEIEIDPTVIKSIGEKIDIYKGLSDGFIHEIKSIQGERGIIIENKQANPEDCNDKGEYINVRIDEEWLRANICDFITQCGGQPIQTPLVTDIPVSLAHQGLKVFNLSDFTSHYVDPQGDPLSTIRLIGSVVGYTLNGVNYVTNTEITQAELSSLQFHYQASTLTNAYSYTTPYQAKDSQGNWSNIANIIVNVSAKNYIQLDPVTVSLIRGILNNKIATVGYSNATGQVLTAGQVLYTIGTPGQLGHLTITVQSNTTLNGNGSFGINIVSTPTTSQVNQSVSYVIDGTTGIVNLQYDSLPAIEDININLANRGVHNFTVSEFVNAYFDYDGDALAEVRIMDSTIGYEYDENNTNNYVAYIAGTWIPVNNSSRIRYTALNQNPSYLKSNAWQGKDVNGVVVT